MHYLAAFLLNVFGSLLTVFTTTIGKKVAFGLAAISFLAALFVSFLAAIKLSLSVIQYSFGDYWLIWAVFTLWPPHLDTCISVIISARITKWAYVETKENLKVALYIT